MPRYGLYTEWNLAPSIVAELDTYELWNTNKQTLRSYMYKLVKDTNNAHIVVSRYHHYILYKGALYDTVWQNDSAPYYFTELGSPDEKFIISFRAKGDVKVALVQRRWT